MQSRFTYERRNGILIRIFRITFDRKYLLRNIEQNFTEKKNKDKN